jgi:hypothetical protein
MSVESAKSAATNRNLDVAIVSHEAMNVLLFIPMIPPERSVDAGLPTPRKQKDFEWKRESVLATLDLALALAFAIKRLF